MGEQLRKPATERDSVEDMAARDAAAQEAAREQSETQAAAAERGEELKGEMDDLLDAIDEVLEVNAEEFVRGYIQKGGQ